jgi:hypothetical protein
MNAFEADGSAGEDSNFQEQQQQWKLDTIFGV